MADKKRSGDKIKLIIPETLGNCVIKSVPTSELEKIIGEDSVNEYKAETVPLLW